MNNPTISIRSSSSNKPSSRQRTKLSPVRPPSRNSFEVFSEISNDNFGSTGQNYYQEDILRRSRININQNNINSTDDRVKLLIKRNIDYLAQINRNENELFSKFDSLYEENNILKEKIKNLENTNSNLQEEKNKQLKIIDNLKNRIILLCKIISVNKSNMTVEEVDFNNLNKIQEMNIIKSSGIDIITNINRSDNKFRNYVRETSNDDIQNPTYNLFIRGQQFYPIQEQDSATEMMGNKKHTAIYIQLSLLNINEAYNCNYKIAMRLKNNIKDKDSESIGITEEKTGKNLEFSSMLKIILSHDMEQCLLFDIFRNNDNYSSCTTKYINSSSLKNSENNNNFIKICESYMPLSQLLSKNNMENTQEVKEQSGNNIGQLKIKGYLKVEDCNEQMNKSCNFSFKFEFPSSSKNDISLIDSFYFLRTNFGEMKRIVYKSDEFKNDSSIIDNFKIDKKQLVNSNDEIIEIEFVDRKKHKSVGKGKFSINEIKIKQNQGYFDLFNVVDYPKLRIAKYFINIEEKEIMTFDKFRERSYKFKVDIAIDYGKGNNENKCSPNDYILSIENCVKIISEFVSNKSFSFYGFGGTIKDSDISTKQKKDQTYYFRSNNEIEGIEGIINEYKYYYLNQKIQSQPSCFSPIISEVINKIENDHKENKFDRYYILMIFTSGKINDLDNTRNAIMMAAGYPLSIIIIGIGRGEFSEMIELDSAEQLFKNEKGETVRRDLVRFVKFENFKNKIMNKDLYGYQELKEDLLKEIPKHIKDYFNEIVN